MQLLRQIGSSTETVSCLPSGTQEILAGSQALQAWPASASKIPGFGPVFPYSIIAWQLDQKVLVLLLASQRYPLCQDSGEVLAATCIITPERCHENSALDTMQIAPLHI